MKAAIIAGCVALLLATGAAYAAEKRQMRYLNILPPIEFDKPYTGELEIVRFLNSREIQTVCKEQVHMPALDVELMALGAFSSCYQINNSVLISMEMMSLHSCCVMTGGLQIIKTDARSIWTSTSLCR